MSDTYLSVMGQGLSDEPAMGQCSLEEPAMRQNGPNDVDTSFGQLVCFFSVFFIFF